jgi:hypothetical protein
MVCSRNAPSQLHAGLKPLEIQAIETHCDKLSSAYADFLKASASSRVRFPRKRTIPATCRSGGILFKGRFFGDFLGSIPILDCGIKRAGHIMNGCHGIVERRDKPLSLQEFCNKDATGLDITQSFARKCTSWRKGSAGATGGCRCAKGAGVRRVPVQFNYCRTPSRVSTNLGHPSSELHRSSSELHRSSSELHRSSSELHRSSSELHRSSSELHRSSSEFHRSSSELHRSSSELHCSSSELHRSSSYLDRYVRTPNVASPHQFLGRKG